MSAALDLIQTVTANGGSMRVEGDTLVISPDSAALPIIEDLRQHKQDIIHLLQGHSRVPFDDPEAWRIPFAEWRRSQCTASARAFGGFVSLHLGFCEWEHERGGVPCAAETFASLLSESNFLMGEIQGTVLVSGLILREDAEEFFIPKN